MKYSKPTYLSHRGKQRDTVNIELRTKKKQEGMKTKGTLILDGTERKKKNLTITTNCSHYCSNSLHQYCESYQGASGPATAIPIIFLMAVITHHRGNGAWPPLF